MAVDTTEKKLSVMNMDTPFTETLPDVSTWSEDEWRHLMNLYADVPSPGGARRSMQVQII